MTKEVEFDNRVYELPEGYVEIVPERRFNYRIEKDCWVIGESRSKDFYGVYIVGELGVGQLEDPQNLADWSIKESN